MHELFLILPGSKRGSCAKTIYNFKNKEIAAAWKVVVNQPWLGAEHGAAHYFIRADYAEVGNQSTFERVERATK
jgi:hypothetical protein